MNTNADLLKELRIDRNAQPPPSRRGMWIGIGTAIVLLMLASAGWLFLRRDIVEVRTAPVVAIGNGDGSAASVLDATGYVVARRMATVSSKITGKVREVLIEEGQRVEAGQIMARLDPIDADAQRDVSRAQLQAASSQVGSIQARLVEAESNLQRISPLVGQQLVSKSQYDQSIAQRDALRAELLTAQRNAQVANKQLDIADLSVDNTIVRAPFAGVITAKAAQPGEIVSPLSAGGGFTRTGIGTVVDMDSLEVEVDVGEAFIGRVQPKMPVEATLNAYPEWQIPAEVIAIIPAADRGKATVKVRIALKQKDPRIVPDMGVRVSFLEAAMPEQPKQKLGVLVPAGAIVERGGKPTVFALKKTNSAEQSVEARGVTLGRALGDDREVMQGLSGGETVVIDPPDSLVDGRAVREAHANDRQTQE